MDTKALIYREIEKLDQEELVEFYRLVRGFCQARNSDQKVGLLEWLKLIQSDAPEDFSTRPDDRLGWKTAGPKSDQHDPQVSTIEDLLDRAYKTQHPKAEIDVRRSSPYSIRVRIIDPDFRGMSLVDRDDRLRIVLRELPEEVQVNMTMLLLLTPEEAKTSFANLEFEEPSRPLGP